MKQYTDSSNNNHLYETEQELINLLKEEITSLKDKVEKTNAECNTQIQAAFEQVDEIENKYNVYKDIKKLEARNRILKLNLTKLELQLSEKDVTIERINNLASDAFNILSGAVEVNIDKDELSNDDVVEVTNEILEGEEHW